MRNTKQLEELEKLLTLSQAAERIGLSRQRVHVLAHEGRIRGVQIGKAYPGRPVWALELASVDEFKEYHDRYQERLAKSRAARR